MRSINRQAIDHGLFLYGGIVAFILTVIAIINLSSVSNLVTLLLFLPVSLYFIYRAATIFIKNTEGYLNRGHAHHPYFSDFSLKTFVSQEDTFFLISSLLLSLALAIVLFRVSLALIS